MHYFTSTRDKLNRKTASEAILEGLSSDGGLYTPDLSEYQSFDLNELLDMNYQEMAVKIIGTILDDYSIDEIKDAIYKAYDNKFDIEEIVKVRNKGGIPVLELYHGPTCAFKDMALTVLPHLLTKAYSKQGEDKKIMILTATSGDTGKAALEGFKDVENTYICVFYPKENVSKIQERQMLTTGGDNTCVIKLEGNFDDCQKVVKDCFELSFDNIKLSSANSINLGRLMPQVVYYFYAYLKLVKNNEIKLNDKISFSVPSGNFGDILAGYIAKALGCPVNKLICASNKNDVLTDFINTGIYNRKRPFYSTISPSMDILVSSNVERLLYFMSNDDVLVKNYMNDLKTKGEYQVNDKIFRMIKESFAAYSFDDEACKETIRTLYNKDGKIIDPHTSVAYRAAMEYMKDNDEKVVVLSTASPYKFAKDVCLSIHDDKQSNDFDYLRKLEEIADEKIPASLRELENMEIRHDNNVTKDNAKDFIIRKAETL
ncbi:MAG: threonine synthase [Erysipelotrichaceae bacterium]